jgi:hypothetical protein
MQYGASVLPAASAPEGDSITAIAAESKSPRKHQSQHAICIQIPACNRGAFSAADLAARVSDAFDLLRDRQPRKKPESGFDTGKRPRTVSRSTDARRSWRHMLPR